MSGSFARDKGQRAERQVVKMLQPVVDWVYREHGMEAPMLERNLMQSHKGGHDIVGLDWLALEVKHHETLAVEQWWQQAKDQAAKAEKVTGRKVEPVLIYKQNRTKWRVRLFGVLRAGGNDVRCPVEVSDEAFLVWFHHSLDQQLKNGKDGENAK